MKPIRPGTVLLAILAACSLLSQAQSLALHDGDRVVFYGDSITAQRLYTRFVEDFFLTRYPQLNISFWNAGVPGDTAYGGYTGDMPARLRRDVEPHQPTVVAIMLGMNDGYYMDFNPKYLDVFTSGYRKLLDGLQAESSSPRITLISPTPYDEVTHGTEFARYNQTVSRYSAAVKDTASSSHLTFSDFNAVQSALLHAAAQTNSSLAPLLVPDRIHPAESSHWVMAATLARTWGVSPIVSNVQIDVGAGKAVGSENAEITGLALTAGRLQWTQADKSLPLPIALDDAMLRFVLTISGLAKMDQQTLQVTGLQGSRYNLAIDGKKIATFSREELSSGVNLALYPTPMEAQARTVDSLELKRTRLDEAGFILVIEDQKAASDTNATRAIEARDAALRAEQRKAAQPKPHLFELTPE